MVTTSYVSPEMEALDTEAKEKGIILLNEIGEDPGIDHMGAKQMIDQAHAEGGKVLSLVSYGAGLPSFQDNRNPVGYKFSWSPRGVMMAAQTAAA
jgi:saccharopine dehydrogenase-like NADP-dependent oxidoreductase